MKLLTKNRLVTIALTIGVLAMLYRNDTTKGLILGDTGGLFG